MALQTSLSKGYTLDAKQSRLLIKRLALHVLSISQRPGEDGLITQIARKAVVKYPSLGVINEEKDTSVIFLTTFVLMCNEKFEP